MPRAGVPARYVEHANGEIPPVSAKALGEGLELGDEAERLEGRQAVGVERAMLQHLVHEDVEMVTLLGDVARALR